MPVEDSVLEEVVQTVLGTTVGLDGAALDGAKSPSSWHSTVVIEGAWNGRVTVDATETLSTKIAEAMFSAEPGSVTDADRQDAIGEMANQMAGMLKPLLPAPSSLSVPQQDIEQAGASGDSKVVRFSVGDGELGLSISGTAA